MRRREEGRIRMTLFRSVVVDLCSPSVQTRVNRNPDTITIE